MDMEAAMKRIPPHSAEAEQAVLGAMLMNKEAITVASEILSGDDFYQTACGKTGRSDHLAGISERKGCPARDQQHGVCKRFVDGNTDFCEYQELC